MTAILLSKLGSLLDEDEEQTKSSQVKEALRQVKKVREGEKLGPEGEVGLEANEAEAEEVPDEEEDIVPDEQPDDAWFIPVGWPQRKPREYYRGSDPEWRSFTEFAKNEERGRLVRSELAAIVHAHVSNDKRLQRILGTPISAKKIWLDVDFPYGPPQEYEQWG
ncbi:MAG: hypothetical protein LQ340_003715 [Diploschistes diacapsis]|nr:MAG: hypothetical protein LQ340_003715 [Diploschistes diacapsis]